MEIDSKAGWRIDKLEIEFKTYQIKDGIVENFPEGKYFGKVRFANKEDEGFNFKLSPEQVETYIRVLSRDIVTSANELGERLLVSLGLKDAPKNLNQAEQ